MSLSEQNPLIGNGRMINRTNSNVSPQEWEFIQTMRKTGWQEPPNIQQTNQIQQIQSDPYSDFEIEFNKCSPTVQNRILNDEEFKIIMNECDRMIQSAVESIVRPQVIQTPNGRLAFERMLGTFRQLRDRYSQEEIRNMERFQKMMQDEVVQKRLAELEQQSMDKNGGSMK